VPGESGGDPMSLGGGCSGGGGRYSTGCLPTSSYAVGSTTAGKHIYTFIRINCSFKNKKFKKTKEKDTHNVSKKHSVSNAY